MANRNSRMMNNDTDYSSLYNPCEMEVELGKLDPGGGIIEYSTDRFVQLIKRHNVKLISLLHIGEDGQVKTLDFCPHSERHLVSVLEGGERCDGSSVFPHSGIPTSSSDIVLRPRLDTAFFDPFAPVPYSVLCFFCWHYGTDGRLLPQSPSTIIHRAEELLLATGERRLWAHGEIEYFVGKKRLECHKADTEGDDRGYHASAPHVFGQELRREAIMILTRLGVHVKYGHTECGYISATDSEPITWEQHEVELALEPLEKAARSAVLTKWVLSNLAHKHSMRISFDPICRKGHIGSGFHVHVSPRHGSGPDDYVLIRDETTGDLATEALHLIAGLSQLGGALMAFGNRTESSFVRLSQGKEAPSTVCWGDRNRKALIRLPLVAKNEAGELVASPTVEFRLGDGSANPLLLMAGIAMAMVYGSDMDDSKAMDIVSATKSVPGGASASNARQVPLTRAEVSAEIQTFRDAFERGGVFPKTIMDAIIDNSFAGQ